MRVECESCRALVDASFAVTGGTARATCPACHHVMTAAPAPPAAPEVEAALCPKCGAPRDGEACKTCGLAASRMAAFSAARDADVPAAVQAAWQRVTAGWDDAARHDELLRLVTLHHAYAWAASRYRARRDDVATRQLERLRRAAEATLFASATVRPDAAVAPYRATRAVLVVLIVAVLVGLVYAMVMRGRSEPVRSAPVPARPLVPGHPVSPSTVK